MKNYIGKLIIVCLLALLGACVSPTRLNFSCDDPTIDIYIDGEYAGKSLVNYAFPNSKQDVVVSCYDGGSEKRRGDEACARGGDPGVPSLQHRRKRGKKCRLRDNLSSQKTILICI